MYTKQGKSLRYYHYFKNDLLIHRLGAGRGVSQAVAVAVDVRALHLGQAALGPAGVQAPAPVPGAGRRVLQAAGRQVASQ